MDRIKELEMQLDRMQKQLHMMKKASVMQEDFLHSGELSLMKIIANYHFKLGLNPTLINVSNLIGISQATVTTLVERLIKKGLIIKEPSQEDKRAKLLSLTSKGEEYLKGNKIRQREKLASIMQALAEQDILELARILKKVNLYFERE